MVNLLQQQLKQLIEQGHAKDETIAALTTKSESLFEQLQESREEILRMVPHTLF